MKPIAASILDLSLVILQEKEAKHNHKEKIEVNRFFFKNSEII